VAHALGWWGKMVMFRDWGVCWILSLAFEGEAAKHYQTVSLSLVSIGMRYTVSSGLKRLVLSAF
jgi:hypothetical protein